MARCTLGPVRIGPLPNPGTLFAHTRLTLFVNNHSAPARGRRARRREGRGEVLRDGRRRDRQRAGEKQTVARKARRARQEEHVRPGVQELHVKEVLRRGVERLMEVL